MNKIVLLSAKTYKNWIVRKALGYLEEIGTLYVKLKPFLLRQSSETQNIVSKVVLVCTILIKIISGSSIDSCCKDDGGMSFFTDISLWEGGFDVDNRLLSSKSEDKSVKKVYYKIRQVLIKKPSPLFILPRAFLFFSKIWTTL